VPRIRGTDALYRRRRRRGYWRDQSVTTRIIALPKARSLVGIGAIGGGLIGNEQDRRERSYRDRYYEDDGYRYGRRLV